MNWQKEHPADEESERPVLSAVDKAGKAKKSYHIVPFLPSSWNRDWLLALLLAFGTIIVYLPVRHAGFIWDDYGMILNNPLIPRSDGWYRVWFNRSAGDFVPPTVTSFWLEWRLWGANPLGYHLDNILLHVCNALLLWGVLLRLKIPSAWLAAAIFAVHPVNVASVAWITERKNTLTMLLLLTSVHCYLTFEDSGRRRWFCLAAGIYLLALTGKTAVVPLPVVLLGLGWWRRGRIDRKDVQHSLIFFALAGTGSLLAIWIQHGASIGAVVRTESLWARSAGAGWALWFYLYKAVLPLNLIFIYPRWQIDPRNALSYIPLILWGTGLLICWQYRNAWGKGALFALGYFSVMLLPVLGFLNIYFMRFSLVADHWQYFAIIGPIALVAAIIRKPVLGAALLLVLGVLTWKQCGMYTDTETLWRATLRQNPDCWMAQVNLGSACLQKGQLDMAIAYLENAVQTKPDFAHVHGDLGIALLQQGRVDDAITQFQTAVQLTPDNADAHYDLGSALRQTGKLDEAVKQLQEAMRLDPASVKTFDTLGDAYMSQGKLAEAMAEFKTALRLKPDDIDTQKKLADALIKTGEAAKAIPYCEAVVKAEPDDAHAYFTLGLAYLVTKQPEQALANYKEASRVAPNTPQCLNALAWIYATSPKAELRNGAEAVRLAAQACHITKRQNIEMLDTLAAAYAETSRFDEAIKTVEEIRTLSVSNHDTNTLNRAQRRLDLYKIGKPYRDEQ